MRCGASGHDAPYLVIAQLNHLLHGPLAFTARVDGAHSDDGATRRQLHVSVTGRHVFARGVAAEAAEQSIAFRGVGELAPRATHAPTDPPRGLHLEAVHRSRRGASAQGRQIIHSLTHQHRQNIDKAASTRHCFKGQGRLSPPTSGPCRPRVLYQEREAPLLSRARING